jgi:hypothetical protein
MNGVINKKRIGLIGLAIGVFILVIVLIANSNQTKVSKLSVVTATPESFNIVPALVTPRIPPTVSDFKVNSLAQSTSVTFTPVIVPSATPTLPPLPTITPTPTLPRLAILGAGTTVRGDLTELKPQDTTSRFVSGQAVFAYVNFAEGQPEIDRIELSLYLEGVLRTAQAYPVTKASGFLIVPLGKLNSGNYKLEIRYNKILQARQPEFKVLAPPKRVFALGDSVMLGAYSELYRVIPNIEVSAEGSRQVTAGLNILRSMKSSGRLGDAVIVHLGTNGAFSARQFDEIMQILEDVPRVLFVNVKVPRGWTAPNNKIIADGVARYQNASLIDWSSYGELHPEFFSGDGIHLSGSGARAYTEQIYDRLMNG